LSRWEIFNCFVSRFGGFARVSELATATGLPAHDVRAVLAELARDRLLKLVGEVAER
jgi:DNA-binding IclR family transcriptional regulator